MVDRSRLRHVLLSLLPGDRPAEAPALDQDEWSAIDAMAAEHRLQPLLHACHGKDPAVPQDIRDGWRRAFRDCAIASLVQRADLADAVARLRSHGIEPLALKGAWLARYCYPGEALRPLRDVDLLLPEAEFERGVAVLQEGGYAFAWDADLPLAEIMRFDKSPPPLVAPRGTAVELHLHAWFPEGRLEWFCPSPDDAGMFARSRVEDDGIRYPCPSDMLAHLIIHAVYSHRLDCGPLVLADLHYLIGKEAIDWEAFWERAGREGWRNGARLVLELVARHCPGPGLPPGGLPGQAPTAEMLDSATHLLLQSLDTRNSASFLADLRSGNWSALRRRSLARTRVADGDVTRDLTTEGGFAAWAGTRLRRTLAQVTDRDVRRQAKEMAKLSRWIDS